MKRRLYLISAVLFNVLVVLFGLIMAMSVFSGQWSSIFNDLFGGPTTKVIEVSEEEEDTIYYKTWYQSVADLMDGNDAVSAAVMAEGSVLLKNDNAALPLAAGSKVSLFGVTAYDPIYSMNGGATKVTPNADRRQFYRDTLEAAGLEVNAGLADWYNNNAGNYFHGAVSGNASVPELKGAPWNAVEASGQVPAADGGTAVFVFGRVGNEGADIPFAGDGYGSASNYLELTDNEKSVLNGLKDAKAAGKFDNVVVIINSTNVMQEDFPQIFDAYGVDAALWIGTPGSGGLAGVAGLIAGKSTPSGRLSDMWYTATENNPSTANFISTKTGQNGHDHTYTLYQEGMYVGYRYAETRYEDYVTGAANAPYDYDTQVSYPFGYGLSYADFSYTDFDVQAPDKQDGEYTVNVTVKNNSETYAGKEVVQIYVQKPYTAYDKANKIEDPAVELVGFGKTSKLRPGASETVSVKVDANRYFASFDAYGKGTYILEADDHYLTAAKNSHDAVNNFLAAKNYNTAGTDGRMDADGKAELVKKIAVTQATADSYAYKTNTGAPVTELFAHADPNRCDPDAAPVTFMSRNDWNGTVSASRTLVESSSARCDSRAFDKNQKVEKDGTAAYPTYGKIPAEGVIPLISLRIDENGQPRTYDDPLWETFLDQLSWEESVYLVSHGWRTTAALQSVSKPALSSPNGPLGFNWKYNYTANEKYQLPGFAGKIGDPDGGMNCIGYPHHSIIASTFNTELMYAVGQAYGEDGLWAGFGGIFGFGLNLHRNPYGGRNGEYFSDDGFLAGVTAGWMSKGIQSKGCHVYNKHFVLNDMDHNRTSPYETWITEQTFRQVYLRAFEVAVQIGDASNVMISFTRIGSRVACSDTKLLTDFLRGECGMKGYAITDGGYSQSYGHGMVQGVLSGCDLPDGTLGGAEYNDDGSITISAANEFFGMDPQSGGYGHVAQAMRESVHRVMYVTVHSNAMNYFSSGTKIVVYPAAWPAALNTVVIVVSVLFGLSAAFAAAMSVIRLLDKRKEQGDLSEQ